MPYQSNLKIFNLLLFLTFFLCKNNIYSQDIDYVRKIIDTLCSPAFSGRGYLNNGSVLASNFIANEFRRFGLDRFDTSYHQYFTISINTLPYIKVLGFDTLKYYVDPMSGTIVGDFETVVFADTTVFKKMSINKLVKFLNKHKYRKKALIFSHKITENTEIAKKIYTAVYDARLKSPLIVFARRHVKGWSTMMLRDDLVLPYAVIDLVTPEDIHPKNLHVNIKHQYYQKYQASNVIGYLPGSEKPDSIIILCAHYDHLGMMGDIIFPGANDNASGVALLLDLAKHFSQAEIDFRYTIVFIAFAAEELGLVGSKYYVLHPFFDLKKVLLVLNFDMVGTGADGIQIANSEVYPDIFRIIESVNLKGDYFRTIKLQHERCNSDHCFFHKRKIPAIHIFTLDQNYKWYHVPEDNSQNLPLTAYESLFRLIRDFLNIFSHTNNEFSNSHILKSGL